MMDYVIWKPEHDGHAPPNWREWMPWDCEPFSKDHSLISGVNPSWLWSITYKVPAEALNSPNDDAETSEAVETGKLENIVRGLRQYPAEELAKHGITLAPERDWATELWAELLEAWCDPIRAIHVRDGRLYEDDRAAIKVLRARFEQMKGEG